MKACKYSSVTSGYMCCCLLSCTIIRFFFFSDEPKSIGLYLLNAGHKQVHISVITSIVMSLVLFYIFYVHYTLNMFIQQIMPQELRLRMFLWGVIVLNNSLFNIFMGKCLCRFLNNCMENVKCQV